jgi:hypothetical protein
MKKELLPHYERTFAVKEELAALDIKFKGIQLTTKHIGQVFDVLIKLPYFDSEIQEDVETRFFNYAKILSNSPLDKKRLMWHFKRFPVIGGSDVGSLIASYTGKKDFFMSAEDLAKQKLLFKYPDQASPKMLFGSYVEETTRESFYQQYEAKPLLEHKQAFLRPLAFDEGWFPLSQVNPDDFVSLYLPEQDKKVNLIIDYKATVDEISENDPDIMLERYFYQLWVAKMEAESRGMPIDGIALVKAGGIIEQGGSFNLAKPDIRLFSDMEEKFICDTDKLVMQSHYHFMDSLMNGLVPKYEYKQREKVEETPEIQTQVKKIQYFYSLIKESEKQLEQAKEGLQHIVLEQQVNDNGYKIGQTVKFDIKQELDIKKIEHYFNITGQQELLSSCFVENRVLDEKKVIENMMASQGLTEDEIKELFYTQQNTKIDPVAFTKTMTENKIEPTAFMKEPEVKINVIYQSKIIKDIREKVSIDLKNKDTDQELSNLSLGQDKIK